MHDANPLFSFRLSTPTSSAFVLCPPAGVSSLSFITYQDELPNDITLWINELPGHGIRSLEQTTTSFHIIVRTLVRRIIDCGFKIVILFGHSLGARIALEATRMLEMEGIAVRLLVLAGWLPVEDSECETRAMSTQNYDLPTSASWNPEHLHCFNEYLAPIWAADLALARNYRFTNEPSLCSNLLLLTAKGDLGTPVGMIPRCHRITTGSLSYRVYEGDHLFVFHSWKQIVADILLALGEAERPSGGI